MACKSQNFLLSWPVSVNGLWRAYKGRNILSKRAREWAKTAKAELALQRPKPIKGPVCLSFALSSPYPNRPYDPSNRIKAVEDLLVEFGIIEDDNNSIVKQILIYEGSGFTGVTVTVEPV